MRKINKKAAKPAKKKSMHSVLSLAAHAKVAHIAARRGCTKSHIVEQAIAKLKAR